MTDQEVQCPSCKRKQPDYGIGATCDYCGCSPLYSFSYPPGSPFYPKPKPGPPKGPQKPLRKRTTALPTGPVLRGNIGPKLT